MEQPHGDEDVSSEKIMMMKIDAGGARKMMSLIKHHIITMIKLYSRTIINWTCAESIFGINEDIFIF